jgi:hypothetical protein
MTRNIETKKGYKMGKIIIPVLFSFFAVSIFAQTNIPTPPGTTGETVYKVIAIGDYDGDGCDDILVWWNHQSPSDIEYSVYSFKKSQHLLTIKFGDVGNGYQLAADLNGDKKVEIVVGSKIYSYNSTLSKKKL